MSNDSYTEDLKDFGYREMDIAADLMKAYANNPPDWLYDDVRPAFNRNSGYVFLIDSEYNVAMVDDKGNLYPFLYTPYDGHEGSIDELIEEFNPGDLHQDDVDYILSWIEAINFDVPKLNPWKYITKDMIYNDD